MAAHAALEAYAAAVAQGGAPSAVLLACFGDPGLFALRALSAAPVLCLAEGSMIDGAQGGNATRHLNHACEPNVEAVEEYGSSNQLLIVIRTTRPIVAGEELFLDYALEVDGDDPAAYPCACGSAQCRGTLVATTSGLD